MGRGTLLFVGTTDPDDKTVVTSWVVELESPPDGFNPTGADTKTLLEQIEVVNLKLFATGPLNFVEAKGQFVVVHDDNGTFDSEDYAQELIGQRVKLYSVTDTTLDEGGNTVVTSWCVQLQDAEAIAFGTPEFQTIEAVNLQ